MPSQVCSCQVKFRIRFVFGIPSVNKLHLGTHYTRHSVDSSLHLHSMYWSCIPLPVSLVCLCQVCSYQVKSVYTKSSLFIPSQVCSYQVKSGHTKSSLFIPSQVCSYQVKYVHTKSSLFMSSQVCSYQVKSVHAKSSLFMSSQVCSCQVKSRVRFVFGIPSVNKVHLGSHYTRRSVDSSLHLHSMYWSCILLSVRQVCSCQVKSVHAKSSLFMPSQVCSCQVKFRIRFVFGIPSVNKLHLGTHYTRRSVDSSLHLHSMYRSCIPLPVSLVCLCQVCSYQVKSVHIKSSLFRPSQVCSCQVKSVHVKSSLFMPSQVCSCQVKSVPAKSSLELGLYLGFRL